jgi:hypothetical protein
MEAVYLKAFANSFAPVDQLRYRTPTTLPSYPNKLTAAAMRATPTCLWRDWSIRFTVGRFRPEVIRPAMSIMLLTTGTQISATIAAQRLGCQTTEKRFSQVLNEVYGHPLWPNIAAAIIRLADYLAENPGPIDYQRRRHLDYRDLLPAAQWKEISDQANFRSRNDDQVGALVGAWLFERVSMQPATMSPFAADTHRAGRRQSEIVARFTPTVIRVLDCAAADFLERHGATGEPVAWSPPLSIVGDLDLPGPDTAAISIAQLHQAFADRSASMALVARYFGVPTDVVRYLLECSPMTRPAVHRQTQLEYAATRLTCAEFVRLHHRDHMSIAKIAGRIGVQRKVMFKLAHKYGIEVRDNKGKVPDDPDWIYQEYVVKERTLTDMAAEVGIELSTLCRRAKRHGITVCHDRGKGHTSKMS